MLVNAALSHSSRNISHATDLPLHQYCLGHVHTSYRLYDVFVDCVLKLYNMLTEVCFNV